MWKSKKRDHLQPYNHSLLKTKKQIGAMPCLKGYLFFVLQFRCWIPERIQEHESCQGPEGPDRPSPLTNTKANSRCEQSRSNISVYNQDKDCKHHWKKESFDWVYSIFLWHFTQSPTARMVYTPFLICMHLVTKHQFLMACWILIYLKEYFLASQLYSKGNTRVSQYPREGSVFKCSSG